MSRDGVGVAGRMWVRDSGVFAAVHWVFPQVVLLFLPLIAAGTVVSSRYLLSGVIHSLWVIGRRVGVRAALRLGLLQVVGLGLTQGATFIGQGWPLLNLSGPLQCLIALQAKANPHLDGEASVFVDQDALLDIFVHDCRSGLRVSADAVAVRLVRRQGEAGGAV